MFLNLSKLAIEICKYEGKKKQVDIAQVKEILKVICDNEELSSSLVDIIKNKKTKPIKQKKK